MSAEVSKSSRMSTTVAVASAVQFLASSLLLKYKKTPIPISIMPIMAGKNFLNFSIYLPCLVIIIITGCLGFYKPP